MSNKTSVMVCFEKEVLQKLDEEILKIKYAKSKPKQLKSRSGFINYAISEYLKLPQVTRYLMSKVEK